VDSTIIAVRIANGSFVPIMDTSSKTRRRLVLTTIRDDQTNVQIDLYRGVTEDMENAEYVGSLMIENIEAAPKGQADVALLLGVDESGNLNATATDKNSGEYQSLSVSLESIDQDGYDVPDFELSDEELTLDDLSMDEEDFSLDESESSLSLDDVTLEEDFSLDVESEQSTDTLAAGTGLAGLEAFSDELVSLDDSLSDESLSEIEVGGDAVADAPEAAATETEFAAEELPDLGDGMVEADLGDEDFTFDEVESEADDNIFDDGETLDAATSEEGAGDEFALDDAATDTTEFESEFESGFESEDEIFGEETGEEVDGGLSSDDFAQLDSTPDGPSEGGEYGAGEYGAAEQAMAPRRSNAIIYVGYLVLALAALGVLTYLVFRLLEGPPAPPLRAAFPLLLAGLPMRKRRRVTRRSRSVK
jgi:Hsp70 protein